MDGKGRYLGLGEEEAWTGSWIQSWLGFCRCSRAWRGLNLICASRYIHLNPYTTSGGSYHLIWDPQRSLLTTSRPINLKSLIIHYERRRLAVSNLAHGKTTRLTKLLVKSSNNPSDCDFARLNVYFGLACRHATCFVIHL